jgi:hypothetical protein
MAATRAPPYRDLEIEPRVRLATVRDVVLGWRGF